MAPFRTARDLKGDSGGADQPRNIWSRGEPAVGIWTTSGSPFLTELIGLAEPDYVVIDAQHGFLGSDTARLCLLAMARMAATPLVRVPSLDQPIIGQMLDAGAHGVVVPMIETAEDARRRRWRRAGWRRQESVALGRFGRPRRSAGIPRCLAVRLSASS